MSKFAVYDENVMVNVIRNGIETKVKFSEIKKGDIVNDAGHNFQVGEGAHDSGDADYPGWLLHDVNGVGYFPEDFDAKLITPGDYPVEDSEDEEESNEIPLFWDDLTPAAQQKLIDSWGSTLNYDIPGVALCWLPGGASQAE